MAEKIKEDSLFQLIRSMTKAEKRYFKVNSTHTIGEKNNYMRLFDAMDKLEEFDDLKFRQKFKKEPFVKYLAAEKNYLYELILKTLRAFRSDKSRYIKLLGLVQDIDLLHEKRLYEDCDKRIKKAQKLANELNFFHINGLLIDWKFLLASKLEEDTPKELIDSYHDEVNKNARLLNNYYEYKKLKNEIQIISKKNLSILQPADQEKFNKILESNYLKNPELAESFIAKQEYYTMMGRVYGIEKSFLEQYKVRLQHVQLFDGYPDMKEEYPSYYKFALTNFLIIAIRVNDFEGYEKTIDKMGLGNGPDDFNELKVVKMGGNQMFYLMNNSRWPEALKLSKVLEDMIVRYKLSIPWSETITMKYNVGCLHFIIGNFSEAADRFDYVINEKEVTYVGQILASRILHVVSHFEISPPTVVEYLLGSAMRFSNKLQHNNPFNDIILKGIKRMLRAADKKETKHSMTLLRDELLAIFEKYQYGLALEETICWLISRIENRPLVEVVDERLEIERQMAMEQLKQDANR
jgi:hypothetical protein